jgi:hypothetical protein
LGELVKKQTSLYECKIISDIPEIKLPLTQKILRQRQILFFFTFFVQSPAASFSSPENTSGNDFKQLRIFLEFFRHMSQ